MAPFGGVLFKTSFYVAGAVTGLMVAIPLVGASVGVGAVSRSVPPIAAIDPIGPRALAIQAPMINRANKGSRLEIVSPASGTGQSTHERTPSAVAEPVMTPKSAKPPARAMETPRGCLLSIGVTKSNLATEELTVCMADASMIRSIN